MHESFDRNRFLNLAGFFEGGLVLAAAALAWAAGIDPREFVEWNWAAVAWGVGGAAPLFALFLLSMRYPLGSLGRVKRFLLDAVAPLLAQCRWYDLPLLGLLAGVAEELLFRGVLQPWFEELGGPATGLIAASALFGLAHCITLTYALAAGMVGYYLGWLLDASGERNLVVPVLTHALYDYLAFLALVRMHRSESV